MSRNHRRLRDDDSDDDWGEDEWGVDDDSAEREETDGTIPCPYCGREIAEDAPRCPGCENYISAEDSLPERKPGWIIATVIICLIMVYVWTFGWPL